jgi:tetratricopeptide (TPR) repeat protein
VAKIYISSTYEDLKDYREAVYRALRRDRHDVIAMEDYVARDQRPLQKCLEDVASCDIYVGIFAWRYGFIPDDKKDNPDNLSITELEYRKAKEIGIPCLIFLLDENKDWPLRFIDVTVQSGTKSADNINRFRNDFKNDQIASFFENEDQLASLVVTAVHQVSQKSIEVTSAAVSNSTLSVSSLLLQKPSLTLFKGEKSFFVGREEYINKIIKEKITIPSSRVCIVGPGGSGKSQLAFKAIHQYEKEGLFDLVIPIYFSDVAPMSFSDFLLNIAKSLFDVNDINEFEKLDIEQRKTVIYNFLSQRKKHPLIFLDSYETVSYILNDKKQTTFAEYLDDARNISYFLNNNLPSNTSVLVTSRERSNNFGNREIRIDLAGLHEQETIELFAGLTPTRYLKDVKNIMNNPTTKAVIDKIFERTGGHPLSIEIIAKNTSNVNQINQLADTLGLEKINPGEPDKRLRSLESSFKYTINGLPDNIKNLLYALTIFKSPFPIDVAEKVFNENAESIIDLYHRSLLLEIRSETSFGEIKNPEYWSYAINPAIRNYLERTMQKAIGKAIDDLEKEYSFYFYTYYYNILFDVYNSIGKDVYRSSMARFNLIFNQGSENNDFNRAISFAEDNNDLWYCANISRVIGLILDSFGMLSKAVEYYLQSLGFNQKRNDKDGISSNYKDIGVIYLDMGNLQHALEYHNKALEIDTELNNRVGLAADYKNIGITYRKMGNYPQALEHHKKALEIDADLNDSRGLSLDYKNIGNVYRKMGNYPQALEHHKKALEIDADLNDRIRLADDYKNIGITYSHMGNYPQALEYYKKALAIHMELNDRIDIAANYYNMGFPLYQMNKKEEALQQLNIAKTILLDFQKETGYSHPLLQNVEVGISYLKQDKK